MKVDDDAVRHEVAGLSPTDAFVRYDAFASQIPVDFADHLKKKELPVISLAERQSLGRL